MAREVAIGATLKTPCTRGCTSSLLKRAHHCVYIFWPSSLDAAGLTVQSLTGASFTAKCGPPAHEQKDAWQRKAQEAMQLHMCFCHQLQAEDILGLYPLPQPSEQPSTVAELSASIIAFLQATSDAAGVAAANAAGGYLYRYSYFGDAVPIQSDQSLVVSDRDEMTAGGMPGCMSG